MVAKQADSAKIADVATTAATATYEVPKKGIILWPTQETPPKGWAICNGGSGTPDLRERFVYGAAGTGTAKFGTRGGNAYYTLQSKHMPKHNHTVTLADGGQHNHTRQFLLMTLIIMEFQQEMMITMTLVVLLPVGEMVIMGHTGHDGIRQMILIITP